MKNKNHSLLFIWWLYLSSLLMSFGGGYTFIEIFREKALRYRLLSEDEFNHFFTWGQIIPGPLMFNFSLLSSYHLGKWKLTLLVAINLLIVPVLLSFIFFTYLLPLPLVKVFLQGILLLLPLIILRVILKQIRGFTFYWQYLITLTSIALVYFLGVDSFIYLILLTFLISLIPFSVEKGGKNGKN